MSNIHIKPETKIESVIFCLANSFIMVIGMMGVNLWIHGVLNATTFCRGFMPIYAFAVVLNFFIVVPMVQRVAVRFGIMRYIPFMMTACMAGTMMFNVQYKNALCACIPAIPRDSNLTKKYHK